MQRLDFVHVLGPLDGGRIHSGVRTPRRWDSFGTGSRATRGRRPVVPPLVPYVRQYASPANGVTPRFRFGRRQPNSSFMLPGKWPRTLMNVLAEWPAPGPRWRMEGAAAGVCGPARRDCLLSFAVFVLVAYRARRAGFGSLACCLAAARRGTRIARLHELVAAHMQLCSVAMLAWRAPAESRPAGRLCSPGSHRLPAFGSSASLGRCPGPYGRRRTAGASRGGAARGGFGCGAISSRPLRCSCGWPIGPDVRAWFSGAVQPAAGRTRRSSRG